MVDIATRVFNQNWKIDPIVRSLLDTDFYKLLMNQFIFRNTQRVEVKFKLINIFGLFLNSIFSLSKSSSLGSPTKKVSKPFLE